MSERPNTEANALSASVGCLLSTKQRVVVVLVLMLLAVGLALGVSGRLNWREPTPQVAKLEERIAKRVTDNWKQINELGILLADRSLQDMYDEAFAFYQNKLQPKEVELLVFRNDTLVFWSSDIDMLPEKTDGQVRLRRVSGCRYLVQQRTLEAGLCCVLLSRFYMDYPYQNRLLHNGFCSDFDCMEGYTPSRSQSYGAVQVRVDGVEPFYMIPTDIARLGISQFKPWARWIAVLLLCCAVLVWLGAPFFRRHPALRMFLMMLWLVGIRAFTLRDGFADVRSSLLFSPELFASSALNSSLGDFLINAVVFFALISMLYVFALTHAGNWRISGNRAMAALFALPVWAVFGLADFNFTELVLNSTLPLELQHIFSLNVYTLVAYLAMVCWFSSALLLLSAWLGMFGRKLGIRTAVLVMLLSLLVYSVLAVLSLVPMSLLGLAWTLFVAAIMLLRWYSPMAKRGWIVGLAAVVAVYSTLLVLRNSRQKDDEIGRMLAIGLSSERDPLAELLLGQIAPRLQADTLVAEYLGNIEQRSAELYTYLRREYFRDYLNRYDMRATVCLPDVVMWLDNATQPEECSTYYGGIIERYGTPLSNSGFHFLNLKNGAINYMGQLRFALADAPRLLFVELESRPNWEQQGYPELLVEGKPPQRKLYGHSYAKYHGGRLISQGGDFDYPLELGALNLSADYTAVTEFGGYVHTTYSDTPGSLILVSRKRDGLLNITAAAIYSWVFYLLALYVLLRIARWSVSRGRPAPSFKSRIKWAMGLIIVLSMLLVAGGTLLYSVRNFEHRTQRNLSEKLMSITLELYRDLPMLHDIEINREALQERLIGLSNIFYTDINIYDTTGLIAVTSRPDMFERGLMGRRMDYRAWSEVHWGACAKFVGHEAIGDAQFLSAYVPIVSAGGEIVAYLNLPYFTKSGDLSNELYSIVVAILNVYTLMLLLSVLVGIVISEQITRPLALIRNRMRQVSISGQNLPIEYDGSDEVGQLVSEYNRMLKELEVSAQALVRSQRESAWREMARQVAHEVKNPLTPIKLSLQHLIRAKKAGMEGWDGLFDRFARSLEEQIDALSRIASEFSAIAKLPSAQAEPIDLRGVLADVLNMFVGYADSKINITFSDAIAHETETIVVANRDQLMRVFNNLIINAIQAIGMEREGMVEVRLAAGADGFMRVEVSDSGCGIASDVLPKLFVPNFTTKTGGTGLGLAISKAIVETCSGQIGVESQQGQGATFWVELPYASVE